MNPATAGATPLPGAQHPTANGSEAAVENPRDVQAPSPIDVTTEGTTVVLAVVRCLDEAAGGALLDAASAAVVAGPTRRIEVDLRALDSYTDAGARALVGCRDLGTKLPEGLHYRTGRGPGREALLAAYTDQDASPTRW
jgi:hypothetical protein